MGQGTRTGGQKSGMQNDPNRGQSTNPGQGRQGQDQSMRRSGERDMEEQGGRSRSGREQSREPDMEDMDDGSMRQ